MHGKSVVAGLSNLEQSRRYWFCAISSAEDKGAKTAITFERGSSEINFTRPRPGLAGGGKVLWDAGFSCRSRRPLTSTWLNPRQVGKTVTVIS